MRVRENLHSSIFYAMRDIEKAKLRSNRECTCHCTKNEVFLKDFFSKCDQIHRKMKLTKRKDKDSINQKKKNSRCSSLS